MDIKEIIKQDGRFVIISDKLSRAKLISEVRILAEEYEVYPKEVCSNLDEAMRAAGYTEGGGEMRGIQRWYKRGKAPIYISYERGSQCYVSIS
jgi:hypothetical protein